MKARQRRFALALVCTLAASIAAPAAQAQSYPAGPVKIVVGTGPGASPDVICRVVADQLARLWGQQVVVLNQPGAGGAIAIRAAGNAAPDGGTLYFALASNFVALPELQATFPFDVARDFVPIGYVGEHPMVVGASPTLGVFRRKAGSSRKRPQTDPAPYGSSTPASPMGRSPVALEGRLTSRPPTVKAVEPG